MVFILFAPTGKMFVFFFPQEELAQEMQGQGHSTVNIYCVFVLTRKNSFENGLIFSFFKQKNKQTKIKKETC